MNTEYYLSSKVRNMKGLFVLTAIAVTTSKHVSLTWAPHKHFPSGSYSVAKIIRVSNSVNWIASNVAGPGPKLPKI